MRALIASFTLLALSLPPAWAGLPEVDTAEIEPEPTTPPQTHRWVRVTLNRPYPERRDPHNFFAPVMENFHDLLEQIEDARTDEHVQGMVLRIDNHSLGWSRMQTLRRAIETFRGEDKRAIAYLEQAMPGDYLLATACDEIVMAEEGVLMLNGLQLEGVFLRGLLDLLHIQPQIIQMGQYKGAGDMFTERAFTPPMREAYTAILDDLWGEMLRSIASGRNLEPEQVAALIDQGPFTAEAALRAGLVDQLANPTEFHRQLEISVGDGFTLDTDYEREEFGQADMNLFNIFSMMQPGAVEKPDADAPKIALVFAVGPIVSGIPNPDDPFQDPNIVHSGEFIRVLHQCRDDESIRAVVIRIDSPGGSALASDQIWAEIRALREIKPVVVTMGDIAASGGYYIAMAADEIYAEPGTLTGSIGVIGGKLVLGGMLEQHLGITHDTISRGQNAGLFSPFTPFSDSERAAITALMEDIYEAFTAKAAESRGMTREEIEEVAQGRLWTGHLAQEVGLVDELGGLNEALARAEELANLTDQEREALIIIELPRPMNFMEIFVKMLTGQAAAPMPNVLAGLLTPRELALIGQVQQWRTLFDNEAALALTPVMLTVR